MLPNVAKSCPEFPRVTQCCLTLPNVSPCECSPFVLLLNYDLTFAIIKHINFGVVQFAHSIPLTKGDPRHHCRKYGWSSVLWEKIVSIMQDTFIIILKIKRCDHVFGITNKIHFLPWKKRGKFKHAHNINKSSTHYNKIQTSICGQCR